MAIIGSDTFDGTAGLEMTATSHNPESGQPWVHFSVSQFGDTGADGPELDGSGSIVMGGGAVWSSIGLDDSIPDTHSVIIDFTLSDVGVSQYGNDVIYVAARWNNDPGNEDGEWIEIFGNYVEGSDSWEWSLAANYQSVLGGAYQSAPPSFVDGDILASGALPASSTPATAQIKVEWTSTEAKLYVDDVLQTTFTRDVNVPVVTASGASWLGFVDDSTDGGLLSFQQIDHDDGVTLSGVEGDVVVAYGMLDIDSLPAGMTLHLSGGRDNTSANLSLGGAISNTIALAQTHSDPAALSGLVEIVATYGNEGNDGVISWLTNTRNFGWLPPQANPGNPMVFQFVDGNGRYRVNHSDGHLVFDVVDYDALDAGDDFDADVTTGNIVGALFDEVLDAELTSGATDYRCLYVRNHHTATSVSSLTINAAFVAPDVGTVEIAVDANFTGGASGDDAQTYDGVTAPSIVGSWDDSVTVTDIGPGEHIAVWIRRTIAAASAQGDNPVAHAMRVSVTY